MQKEAIDLGEIALYFAGTVGVMGASFYALWRFWLRKFSTTPDEYRAAEQRRMESLDTVLNEVEASNEMKRLYFDRENKTYQDSEGKTIPTAIIGTGIKNIDEGNFYGPAPIDSLVSRFIEKPIPSSVRVPKEIIEQGKRLGANAVSFSEPKKLHGEYAFSVLYHRTR